MYFDKSRSFVNRHGWTFPHTGRQLAPLALILHDRFKANELEARERVAALMRDATIHHEDRQVIQAKDDILMYGKLREQCAVWVYEFNRTPAREFMLGINDVVFFDIFPLKTEECPGASKRADWKFTYQVGDLFGPFRAKCNSMRSERKGIVKAVKRRIAQDEEDEREFQSEMAENYLLAEEFEINPDKEVILALGDIVYLGLAPLLDLSGETTA